MTFDNYALLSRRDLLRTTILFGAAIAASLWVSFQLLQPIPPRRIVLASGPEAGLYHHYAERYKVLLAREGVTVVVRPTNGAAENLDLLLDPTSGVDIAFMQGGVAYPPPAQGIVMLSSLYYEPLWIFYRSGRTLTQLNQLPGLRITVGLPRSGNRALVLPLLAANNITPDDATLLDVGGEAAFQMLRDDKADVAMMVGGAAAATIQKALLDPELKLMNVNRASAYVRRFPFVTRLTLPAGTVDLARDIPAEEVELIATKAMLAARDGLHPALINLLLEAVRDVHDDQGYFEAAGQFPNTIQVDLPVSMDAVRHTRFGTSLLYRTFPFWIATFLDRTLILIVPLLVVLVPLINFFPQIVRWRVRSRVYRWYGELALLERDVASHQGPPPLERWLATLDRIERAAAGIRIPASFASEAYTLREHIGFVRRAVEAKGSGAGSAAPEG
ncbi:MAG: TAXI family TRAP transporter solute-binding subunit [Betaproteobacteria bacterium]